MNRLSRLLAFALGVFICSGGAATAQGRSEKVDRGVQNALLSGTATVDVIISVKPGYRASVRRALQDHGDLITSDHPSIDALSAVIDSDDVAELARQPWVDSISLDAKMFAIGAAADNSNKNNKNHKNNEDKTPAPGETSGASNTFLRETLAVPSSATGAGITVAIIDSGITPSEDLAPERILAFYDLTVTGCAKPCVATPYDPWGTARTWPGSSAAAASCRAISIKASPQA